MEENEMAAPLPEETKTPKQLVVDDTMIAFLKESAKWAKFLGIVGFVICGLIVLQSLALMFMGTAITSQLKLIGVVAGGFISGFIGFIYILFALLFYFPSKYLYNFSTYTKQAIAYENQENIAYAFERLKSYFKFWGTLTLIVIVIYSFVILVVYL